jgi:di/tricarboxylate transporter
MSTDSWITLGVLIVTGIVLVRDRFPAVIVLGGAVVSLLFAGVIDQQIALSGLSSGAPATIAALYVVAGAATVTGALNVVVDKLLGRGSLVRLVSGTAALSSFVPNTPLVAMTAPRLVRSCQRRGVSASRFLMPLSFASLLGGTITLIGTSTNLVVSDLVAQAGEEPLGVFEITAVGLPVAIVGIVVLTTVGARLLPDRVGASTNVDRRAREFQMAARVDRDGPIQGRTVADSGLRGLEGAFLALIERQGTDGSTTTITAASDTVLEAGDVCCFLGDSTRMIDLHEIVGLTSLERSQLAVAEGPDTRVFEAVVSPSSRLIGETLQSADFRTRYGGAVMAVHRADGELTGQLGRVQLRAGDVLLVLASSSFGQRWRGDADFSLVAAVNDPPPARRHRAWLPLVVVVAMIVTAAAGWLTLFEAAVGAAIIVVVGGVISAREAWQSINLGVVLTMAVAISLGGAVAASGLAAEIASLLGSGIVTGAGGAGLIAAVLIITVALTELVTNTAAAALMVPIGLSSAVEAGQDPRAVAIAVLIGASCSFLSPIGYQTNLMVYGLGGYRFSDFARVGFPLTLTSVATATMACTWLL